MDDELPPSPRPARSNRPAPRSQPAPRSRYSDSDNSFDFDFEFDPPPRARPRSRSRRRKQQSTVRPLHVLLLAVLVIGLIAFAAKALTGGDDGATANASGSQTVAASAAGQQSTAKKAVSATKVGEGDAAQPATTVPLVQARPAPTYQAGAKAAANQPGLDAASYVALDVDRNEIVLAYGDTDRRPIASLTKMMTGLLTSEAGNMWHPVTVSATAAGVEPNKDGLIIGNRYPRGVLLYSAMLGSNNDAAAALGEDLGGGNYAKYYKMMNRRAKQLGMTDTRYASSSGLNDATNSSTARDQAIMLARALENPTFAKAAGTWRHTVRWNDTGGKRTYENHNKMLQTYRGTIAGKTGFTTLAGGCLAVAVRRGGHTIIGVILNTNDIWGDMPKLMDAAFKRSPA